jgi:hypothetical protein
MEPTRRPGAIFVCEVPDALGAVTKLRTIRNRVVAVTESGVVIMLPREPFPKQED